MVAVLAVVLATAVTAVVVGAHFGRAAATSQAGGPPSSAAGGHATPTRATAPTSTRALSPTTTVPATTTTVLPTTTTAPPTTTTVPAPTGIGLARCAFTDDSRRAYDYATGTWLASRTMHAEVRYPTAARRAAGASGAVPGAAPLRPAGGYPTVFFAPGYGVGPDTYAALLDAWARAGFVVVAPSFPDTNPAAVAAARFGNPEDDLTNQPADLAFVIRSALADSAGHAPGCPALRGLLAPGRIGMAGQSDGGDTVALLAYGRTGPGAGLGAAVPVRAVAVLSGSEWPGDTYAATPGDPALLVVQSASDACNPPQESTELYDSVVQRDRWFLALKGADHLGPYDGQEAHAFSTVATVTVDFFRRALAPAGAGQAPSLTAGPHPSGATLTTGPTAPPLAALAFSKAACAAPASVRTS